MPIDAEVYRQAAQERADQAFLMYEAEQYAAAHYLAGLAVECMLYACRIRSGRQLDAGHRVGQLWEEANFPDYLPRPQSDEAAAAVTVVRVRWLNNHRYRSEASLRRWLVESGVARDQGSRGDPLKHSAYLITGAAVSFVTIGELAWQQLQS
ncbi:MAG: HEPN domain-containing protein [Armatimonadetes bacterium]|nr:HEPN domain-containing protein [Armatimonadota bacterium]